MEQSKIEPVKLSIITINKNNADGLKKTIQSVINQTFQKIEYIVIDGNSTDNSLEIINEFQDGITYSISEPDTGIYNAMNKGIKHASGDYCLFLNSGDYLYKKNVIENVFNERHNADIIACGVISQKNQKYFYSYSPKEISLLTFTSGSLLHPATFIRRDLFEKYGLYDEKYRIISDWKFFLEALILHNSSYTSSTDIVSVFDATSGISTLHGTSEEEEKQNILRMYFPKINLDYYLGFPVEYEYIQNIFNILRRKKHLMRTARIVLRLINRLAGGRNENERLISVKEIRESEI
jgi:glycosyltransferase involved in cell wall biosynthesis